MCEHWMLGVYTVYCFSAVNLQTLTQTNRYLKLKLAQFSSSTDYKFICTVSFCLLTSFWCPSIVWTKIRIYSNSLSVFLLIEIFFQDWDQDVRIFYCSNFGIVRLDYVTPDYDVEYHVSFYLHVKFKVFLLTRDVIPEYEQFEISETMARFHLCNNSNNKNKHANK